MKKIIAGILLAVALTMISQIVFAEIVTSNSVSGYVSCDTGDIELASKDVTPNIYVDKNDYEGVIRATGDLQSDINAVTKVIPKITNDVYISGGETGVVLGENPKIILSEDIENGIGIIAVYRPDTTLSSICISKGYKKK